MSACLKEAKMPWAYRVIKRYYPDTDEYTYRIHEVYYDKQMKIKGYSNDPVAPHGETFEDLYYDHNRQTRALIEPVIEYETLRELDQSEKTFSGKKVKEKVKQKIVISKK